MTGRFPHLDEAAARLVPLVLAGQASLGRGRLVCVDGPAGSGKTTLAAALRRELRDALRAPGATRPAAAPAPGAHGARGMPAVRLVHMDDVYDGWTGLEAGMATVASSVVAPLQRGEPGRYRRYDWHRAAFADERVVDACDVLVVEGVGSGSTERGGYAEAVTLLVWVETPSEVRLARSLARDGAEVREHWQAWQAQEEAMFARERTRERADLILDGTLPPTGGSPT